MLIRNTALIKSYAYFKGQLEWAYKTKNEKLINYYKDAIQRTLTKRHTQAS